MGYIEMKNVCYAYPTSKNMVIRNVNLSLEKGRLYALVGKNGSGKTTLCNLIRGFVPHFYKGNLTGEVTIDGKNILNVDIGTFAFTVGYIFENPFNQISGIKETVYEELAYGLENQGASRHEMISKVNKMIDLLGLEELKDKNPLELSGGQQQRVAFGSILIMDTDIIVIDEPTSQLDPQSTESIFKIIQHMKNQGKTIILVEHKMDLIAAFADEVIVIADGEIKVHNTAKSVLTDTRLSDWGVPFTEYTKLGMALLNEDILINETPTTIHEATREIKNLTK